MIPKRHHFVWVGNQPKPPLVHRCIDSWRRFLPDRMRAANLRIGYNPEAVICHEIDPQRLTPGFHAEFQRRLGASEALRSGRGFARRSALRAIESALATLWFAVTGSPIRRTHAWGRVIRHTYALRTLWARRRERA